MAKGRTKRIIQVPIDEDLLKHIDVTAGVVAESRAAFIREACRLRLKGLALKEMDRRYIEGYRKKPEKETWSGTTARVLSRVLPKEKW